MPTRSTRWSHRRVRCRSPLPARSAGHAGSSTICATPPVPACCRCRGGRSPCRRAWCSCSSVPLHRCRTPATARGIGRLPVVDPLAPLRHCRHRRWGSRDAVIAAPAATQADIGTTAILCHPLTSRRHRAPFCLPHRLIGCVMPRWAPRSRSEPSSSSRRRLFVAICVSRG